MSGDDGVEIGQVKSTRVSEKAVLCVGRVLLDLTDDGKDEAWIPKSVIHDDSEVWEKGQEGKLVVKAWWAKKCGWDDRD